MTKMSDSQEIGGKEAKWNKRENMKLNKADKRRNNKARQS